MSSLKSYSAVKLLSTYSNLCDHVPERHGRTDGQADGQTTTTCYCITALGVASRGKNGCASLFPSERCQQTANCEFVIGILFVVLWFSFVKMSKPVGVCRWLLSYLLKATGEKLPETTCLNLKDSLPGTRLVKVIKVLLWWLTVNTTSAV